MKLTLLDGNYSIAKLAPSSVLPSWYLTSRFFSISKSEDEISIVCEDHLIPKESEKSSSWSLIRVRGQLDFDLSGVLNSIADPLAKNEVSLFAVSTFNTDYILIQKKDIETAIAVLENSGFIFV